MSASGCDENNSSTYGNVLATNNTECGKMRISKEVNGNVTTNSDASEDGDDTDDDSLSFYSGTNHFNPVNNLHVVSFNDKTTNVSKSH